MFSDNDFKYVAAGLFGAGTALIVNATIGYVIDRIYDINENAKIAQLKEQVQKQEEVLQWIIKEDIDLQKDSEN